MKITKSQLKKLIEQELKEVEFGLTSPMDAKIQAARAKQREKEEIAMADTVKAEPVQRQAKMPSISDMSVEDRKLFFDAQKTDQFAADPEKMRLAVIRLLRDKYKL